MDDTGGDAGRELLERDSQLAVSRMAIPNRVDPADLYVKTGGNPFFVTEVLAAAGRAVPDTVRDAVLARAARLSPGASCRDARFRPARSPCGGC
jgi:hypothetical protein